MKNTIQQEFGMPTFVHMTQSKKIPKQANKRLVVAFIIASLSVTIFGGIRLVQANNYTVCGFTNDILVSNSEMKGKTSQEINELLANRWLAQKKSVLACPSERLNDYKVEKVQEGSTPDIFMLTYSVSPTNILESDWIAGNGIWEGFSIVHKFGFVKIKQTATGIGIESINTGP